MLTQIHPKLPMRDKKRTREFYGSLGFQPVGGADHPGYLMLKKDQIEIHFFEFRDLDPTTNYGQVYIRTSDIDDWYEELRHRKVEIHPAGPLEVKPWGQKEFSLLDPDNNLLTFGQSLVPAG